MGKRTERLDGRDEGHIARAAAILRSGGLVVFPTETVYGLGANALDAEAARSIFAAKGRPQDNPLIAHVARAALARTVAREVPPAAKLLFEAFAPGPLTIVLPRGPKLPDEVTAGLDTVGVRVPAHPVARALLEAAGIPVVAPSANVSGRPSPTNFAMALEAMDGRADAVIDGGECEHGLESTVVALVPGEARILRPGAVTAEMLRRALDSGGPSISALDVVDASGHSEKPASPGMKYAHYKPSAEVYLAGRADPTGVAALFPGKRVGAISMRGESSGGEIVAEGGALVLLVADEAEYARRLYRAFSLMDARGAELIVCGMPSRAGIGEALLNRLEKASAGKRI